MKKFILIFSILLFAVSSGFSYEIMDDYVDIASSLVQEGKYSQALNYINKALDLDRNNAKLINLQGDIYKLMGREDVPLMFDSSMPRENYLADAVLLYENGNYRIAKDRLTKYLESMPRSDFAYMLRAKVNMGLDEMPSALRDIKSAQAISDNMEYDFVEAMILYNTGKYAQAKDILTNLADSIQIFSVYKYLGLSNFKLGNYKEAVSNFDKALLLSDEDKTIIDAYNEAKRLSYGK